MKIITVLLMISEEYSALKDANSVFNDSDNSCQLCHYDGIFTATVILTIMEIMKLVIVMTPITIVRIMTLEKSTNIYKNKNMLIYVPGALILTN